MLTGGRASSIVSSYCQLVAKRQRVEHADEPIQPIEWSDGPHTLGLVSNRPVDHLLDTGGGTAYQVMVRERRARRRRARRLKVLHQRAIIRRDCDRRRRLGREIEHFLKEVCSFLAPYVDPPARPA